MKQSKGLAHSIQRSRRKVGGSALDKGRDDDRFVTVTGYIGAGKGADQARRRVIVLLQDGQDA